MAWLDDFLNNITGNRGGPQQITRASGVGVGGPIYPNRPKPANAGLRDPYTGPLYTDTERHNNTLARNANNRLPSVNTNPFVRKLDNGLQEGANASFEQIDIFNRATTDAINNAIATMMGFQNTATANVNRVQELFGQLMPVNPYSDQQANMNIARANDDVTRIGNDATGGLNANLSSRGVGPGGYSNAANAILQSGMLQARQGATTDVLNEQQRVNTQANQARAALEAGVTGDLNQNLGTSSAGIATLQRGNLPAIDHFLQTIGDYTSADLGIQNQDEIMRLMRDLNNPDIGRQIVNMISQFVPAFRPGAPTAGAVANQLPNLYNLFFPNTSSYGAY